MNGRGETKLIFPSLAGFYASWRDIAYTLVRVVIGYIMFMHGWAKVTGPGFGGVSGSMAKNNLVPGGAFAGAAMFLETVGAVCIIIGLFTRFFSGCARDRDGYRLSGRPYQQRLRAGQVDFSTPPARHRIVCNRNPGRRAILGRSDDREGIRGGRGRGRPRASLICPRSSHAHSAVVKGGFVNGAFGRSLGMYQARR